MEIVMSIHFVYNWHPNKNCWNVNKLKTHIMDNSNIKLLGCLTISDDRSISIQDSSLVNHSLQGVVECHRWAQVKRGDEQTFGVTKNKGHCYWQRTCILLCDKWQKCLLWRNLLSKITSPLPLWEYTEVRIQRTTVILENAQRVADCFYLHYYRLLVVFNHKVTYKTFTKLFHGDRVTWWLDYRIYQIMDTEKSRILPGYVLCCSSLSTHSTKHQSYHDPPSPKSDVAWNMTGFCSRIILHDEWQVISFFPQRFRVIEQNSDSSLMNFIGNVVFSLPLT